MGRWGRLKRWQKWGLGALAALLLLIILAGVFGEDPDAGDEGGAAVQTATRNDDGHGAAADRVRAN